MNLGLSGLTGAAGNQGMIPIMIYSTNSAAFEASVNGEKLSSSMASATIGSAASEVLTKPLGPIGGAISGEILSDIIKILAEDKEDMSGKNSNGK